MLAAVRRGVGRALSLQHKATPQPPRMERGMADVYVPKPDTSMDHVFGDNSVRLNYDFQPPSAAKTFVLTLVTLGIFGAPIWVMGYEDYKMANFKERLEEAKAKKAPPAAAEENS